MNTRSQKNGFTVVELICVLAMLAVLCLAVNRLFQPMLKFSQRSRARQSATLEARACMETIERVMSNGKTATLVLSASPANPAGGLSQARFSLVDGSSCTISWSNTPENTIHLQKSQGAVVTADSVLASHAGALQFTLDTHDPGIVHVMLMMRVPLDASGSPDSFETILVSNQTILMVAS